MADYLANQIILGNLDYATVIAKKPAYKAAIDSYLTAQGRQDLVVQ